MEKITVKTLKSNETNSITETDLEEIGELIRRGFMLDQKDSQIDYARAMRHTEKCTRVTIASDRSGIKLYLGSNIRRLGDDIIYHLEGIISSEEIRTQGVTQRILAHDLLATNANILAFHTQSIAMAKVGLKLAKFTPEMALVVGPTIHTKNQVGIVDVRRYGKCLYGNEEKFAPLALPGLDWRSGDALICAGKVRRIT